MKTPVEEFLTELDELMPEHPYKKRWMKELNDHLDDLKEDLSYNNRSLSSLAITERMGNPKKTVSDFYEKLHPWRALYYWSEALFTGVIVLSISMMLWPLHIAFFAWDDFFARPEDSSISASILLVTIVPRLLLTCAIWFIVHSLAWKKAYKNQKETGLSMIPWGILITLPFLLIQVIWLKSVWGMGYEQEFMSSETLFMFLGLGGLVFCNLGASFLARHFVIQKKHQTKSAEKPSKSSKALYLFIGLYLIAYGLLRTLGTYVELPYPELANSVGLMFLPIVILEFMSTIMIGMISQNNANILAFAIPLLYGVGLILIFISVQSLVHMIYKKRWSWSRVGLTVYALSILLINVDRLNPELEWDSAQVEIVSNTIEKEQTGLFYPLFKWTNQDEGKMFRYAVDFEDGEFILQQNTGKEFRFRPEEWSESNAKSIVKDAASIQSFPNRGDDSFPDGFSCTMLHEGDAKEGTVLILPNPEDPNALNTCHELFFQGKRIFFTEEWKEVKDLALSSDGKWALIVIPSSFYDPDYVYLVKL